VDTDRIARNRRAEHRRVRHVAIEGGSQGVRADVVHEATFFQARRGLSPTVDSIPETTGTGTLLRGVGPDGAVSQGRRTRASNEHPPTHRVAVDCVSSTSSPGDREALEDRRDRLPVLEDHDALPARIRSRLRRIRNDRQDGVRWAALRGHLDVPHGLALRVLGIVEPVEVERLRQHVGPRRHEHDIARARGIDRLLHRGVVHVRPGLRRHAKDRTIDLARHREQDRTRQHESSWAHHSGTSVPASSTAPEDAFARRRTEPGLKPSTVNDKA
jgi:hypothetical protein